MRLSKALLVAAAKNGRAIPCEVDATKFLLSYPSGAYTAARTVQQTKVFDYEGHIKRLVESTIAMEASKQWTDLTYAHVESVLRPKTESTLRAAMSSFKQQFGVEPKEEYKLTVLVCHDETAEVPPSVDSADVYCHIGLLPPLRDGPVKLVVAGMPRRNASAKDSAWVRERKHIYDTLASDIEEVILMEPDTFRLLEGSQTNFYVLREGVVYTAEEGILKGTGIPRDQTIFRLHTPLLQHLLAFLLQVVLPSLFFCLQLVLFALLGIQNFRWNLNT
ncbi:hypothetical protein ATCC90586_009714 [Pythium insidiosum]|nr:hypothetical protein ATCC90586_009714 [Pythium insidiosum]